LIPPASILQRFVLHGLVAFLLQQELNQAVKADVDGDTQGTASVIARKRQRLTFVEAKSKEAEFDQLKDCLMGELPSGGYRALALKLGSTEAATKMAVHRLKRRFQQELRSEIADTVTDDAVDDELRYLLKALQR